MDVSNTCVVNGSLQISTEVIAKIARMAALEIEGVKEVSPATAGVKGLLSKSKSVAVSLNDDVAELTLQVVVFFGAREGAEEREGRRAEHDQHHRFPCERDRGWRSGPP